MIFRRYKPLPSAVNDLASGTIEIEYGPDGLPHPKVPLGHEDVLGCVWPGREDDPEARDLHD